MRTFEQDETVLHALERSLGVRARALVRMHQQSLAAVSLAHRLLVRVIAHL